MEKRELSAKEILADIKAGMSDSELMQKHHLSEKGLESAFTKLVEMRALKQAELQNRISTPESTSKEPPQEVSEITEDTDKREDEAFPGWPKRPENFRPSYLNVILTVIAVLLAIQVAISLGCGNIPVRITSPVGIFSASGNIPVAIKDPIANGNVCAGTCVH